MHLFRIYNGQNIKQHVPFYVSLWTLPLSAQSHEKEIERLKVYFHHVDKIYEVILFVYLVYWAGNQIR